MTRFCPGWRLTGRSWRCVAMCWRQRGGSVVLWRQTPLSSEPSSSCFCSAWTRRPVSFCSGFSGCDRLSLGPLELELLLYGVSVSALHKAQHGPLTAAPCRQKFTRKEKNTIVGFQTWARGASRSCFSQGARLSVALASSSSIRALIMGVSVQLGSLRWLWSRCLG